MRPKSIAVLLCLLVGTRTPLPAGVKGSPPAAQNGLEWPEVLRLRAVKDYFTLRDRLATSGPILTLPARFARALVEHAFDEPAASNATIAAVLADGRLPDSLVTALRRVQVANDLRLFSYRAGLAATDTLLTDVTDLDSATLNDLRNTRRLFRALVAVPPQVADIRGADTLRLERGRIPVQVNDSARYYVFDTGANLSTIMRSEAVSLGLHIYRAGLDVGTSTDRRVSADLAVADHLTIGRTDYQHVVFLVLDDSLLSFAGGFRIPGIIGFPVIEQVREVQFDRNGEVVFPAQSPARGAHNLELDELTPLTRVGWPHDGGEARLLCRLDTGAQRTQLYDRFYRRFLDLLDSTTSPETRKTGGVGGVRELTVRVLRRVHFVLGDTTIVLDSADVLTRPIARDGSADYLDCNLGHDVLDAFAGYIINLRAMEFVLR